MGIGSFFAVSLQPAHGDIRCTPRSDVHLSEIPNSFAWSKVT